MTRRDFLFWWPIHNTGQMWMYMWKAYLVCQNGIQKGERSDIRIGANCIGLCRVPLPEDWGGGGYVHVHTTLGRNYSNSTYYNFYQMRPVHIKILFHVCSPWKLPKRVEGYIMIFNVSVLRTWVITNNCTPSFHYTNKILISENRKHTRAGPLTFLLSWWVC